MGIKGLNVSCYPPYQRLKRPIGTCMCKKNQKKRGMNEEKKWLKWNKIKKNLMTNGSKWLSLTFPDHCLIYLLLRFFSQQQKNLFPCVTSWWGTNVFLIFTLVTNEQDLTLGNLFIANNIFENNSLSSVNLCFLNISSLEQSTAKMS